MLIVLRGNSGSGKTTIATALQNQLGWPTAVLGQDHFRRVIYRERASEGLAHAELLETAATHCLRAGHHVVMEGIFNVDRYEPMLARIASRSDNARFFAFDLSFEDTLDRHAIRAQAAEFTPEQMRAWYHGWQPLSFVDEHRIDVSESINQIVARILTGGNVRRRTSIGEP